MKKAILATKVGMTQIFNHEDGVLIPVTCRNHVWKCFEDKFEPVFAVLTGCLRIAKESIFTGLNNFNVFFDYECTV